MVYHGPLLEAKTGEGEPSTQCGAAARSRVRLRSHRLQRARAVCGRLKRPVLPIRSFDCVTAFSRQRYNQVLRDPIHLVCPQD